MGAKNQTELLRITLSVAGFVSDIGEIANASVHPHRRKAEALRAGGRLVEITQMGDMSGKPILMIANVSNYTFNARVEQQLFDAGLYVISVCAPGCGKTNPAPKGESRRECIRDDIEAVLKQLGIKRCPILVYNSNSPVSYTLVNSLPGRFSTVLHIAACIPPKYEKTKQTQSTWATAILKASVSHPELKRLLVKGAMKAWAMLGAQKFMRLQLSGNPVEAKDVLLPENIREYEHALKTATQSGVSDAAEDIAMLFDDWEAEIKRIPVNIHVMHGVDDTICAIDGIRRFAGDYPNKVTVNEIQNAGFPLIQSNTGEVIELLKSATNTERPAQSQLMH